MQFRVGSGTVSVNMPTRSAVLARVTEHLRAGRGFAIATLNLDHLVKLRDDSFRLVYAAQDLVTADGHPVVWLSRIAGKPVELVTGADLILPLARLAAAERVRVGLFGSDSGTLDAAAARLRADIPGLDIALTLAPPMGFVPDGGDARAALDRFRAAEVRLVFVALGAPKQERFAAFGRQIVPGMGFASIGAGLDFIAGTQRRAPVWLQRAGMEWLWRMLRSPGRMTGRYLRCMAVLPGHVLDAAGLRR